MQYVGHEGVYAAWYSVATGCLPDIAIYKAFGERVPQKVRYEVVKDIVELGLEDGVALAGYFSNNDLARTKSLMKKEGLLVEV